MIKLDIHLNLGDIPQTKKKTPLHISASQLFDYIVANKLTHVGVIYYGKENMEELISLLDTIDVKYYPFQWVLDIKNVQLNSFDKGICIHSHRGSLDGETYGLDYSKISRCLSPLPENTIIYTHLQGVGSYGNISRAISISNLALNNPHLKFLMEHSGSYLRQEFYPQNFNFDELTDPTRHIKSFYKLAVGSESCVMEACLVSSRIPSVFMDSSIFISKNYKTELLNKNSFWSYGSDHPFENGKAGVDKQMSVMKKHYGYTDEKNQQIHQRGIDWLEKDVRQLWEEELKDYLV